MSDSHEQAEIEIPEDLRPVFSGAFTVPDASKAQKRISGLPEERQFALFRAVVEGDFDDPDRLRHLFYQAIKLPSGLKAYEESVLAGFANHFWRNPDDVVIPIYKGVFAEQGLGDDDHCGCALMNGETGTDEAHHQALKEHVSFLAYMFGVDPVPKVVFKRLNEGTKGQCEQDPENPFGRVVVSKACPRAPKKNQKLDHHTTQDVLRARMVTATHEFGHVLQNELILGVSDFARSKIPDKQKVFLKIVDPRSRLYRAAMLFAFNSESGHRAGRYMPSKDGYERYRAQIREKHAFSFAERVTEAIQQALQDLTYSF